MYSSLWAQNGISDGLHTRQLRELNVHSLVDAGVMSHTIGRSCEPAVKFEDWVTVTQTRKTSSEHQFKDDFETKMSEVKTAQILDWREKPSCTFKLLVLSPLTAGNAARTFNWPQKNPRWSFARQSSRLKIIQPAHIHTVHFDITRVV